MKRYVLLSAAVLAAFVIVAGCQRKRFEVVMQLADDGVRRSVTVWSEEAANSNGQSVVKILPLEDPGSNGLATIYGEPERLADGRARYSRVFAEDLPSDLAQGSFRNFARAQVIRSPLGTTVTYLERLPGRIDMLSVALAAAESCDLLIAAWLAYAGQQADFRDEPERLARLKDFLETELRADMLNLGLMVWLENAANEACEHYTVSTNGFGLEQRLIARGTAFLLERGYAHTSDLTVIGDDPTPLMRGVARKLATRMGYPADAPLPPTLAAFADGTTSIESITSSGLAALGKSNEALSANAELIGGHLFGDTPRGQVTWTNVPHQPVTNGTWDAKSQTIVWSAEYREGAHLPDVLYASFTIPQEAFIIEHFGSILPVGTVNTFNSWHATLSAEQQTRVVAFCEQLKPGPQLRKDILCFDLKAPNGRGTAPGEPENLPGGIRALLADE
jgi:hypothetical protein